MQCNKTVRTTTNRHINKIINLMKNSLMVLGAVFMLESRFCAESSFEEYKLDNGLHVILHNDPSVLL
jgi:hypothetical protein